MASGAPSVKSSGSVTDAAPFGTSARCASRRSACLRLSMAATGACAIARQRRDQPLQLLLRARDAAPRLARALGVAGDAGVVRGDRRRRIVRRKAPLAALARRRRARRRQLGRMAPAGPDGAGNPPAGDAPVDELELRARAVEEQAQRAQRPRRGRRSARRRARPARRAPRRSGSPVELLAQEHAERAAPPRRCRPACRRGACAPRARPPTRAASRRAAHHHGDVVGLNVRLHDLLHLLARRGVRPISSRHVVELRRPQRQLTRPPAAAVHSMRMSLADELSRIAEEAARTRHRLEELSRACAELRKQLVTGEDKPRAGDDVPTQRLQSVS